MTERRAETRWLQALAIAAVLFCLASALRSAWVSDWTYDEGNHFGWSLSILETGMMRRESMGSLSTMPVTLLNALPAYVLPQYGITDAQWLRFSARLATVAWLALLLLTAYLLARRHLPPRAAEVAVIFLALDPSLAAHGSLVTVDLPFAAVTLAFLGSLLALEKNPSIVNAAFAGLWLGVAFATKYTAFLLLAPAALAFLALLWRRGARGASLSASLGLAAVFAGTTIIAVNCGYGLIGSGVRFDRIDFHSPFLLALASRVPDLVPPLPEAFLLGFDRVLTLERDASWNIVILGKFFTDRVWYYFPVVWLVKTPLAILVVQLAGVGAALAGGAEWRTLSTKRLGAALAFFLLYFCFVFRTQVGYRYALLCVPIFALLAAAGIATLPWRSHGRWVAAAVVALAVIEGGAYWGNPLSFTNALVYPKSHAYRWFADSNLDWGQNYGAIRARLARRKLDKGIDPFHMLPGINVFTVNMIAGVWWSHEQHRWLREHIEPRMHLGHTHLIFDVSLEQFDRYLDEVRTAEPVAEASCRSTSAPSLVGNGGTWDDTSSPRICYRASEPRDLRVEVTEGRAKIGIDAGPLGCRGEAVGAGREVWYRLRPGHHRLCVEPEPGFRGKWSLRSRAGATGPLSAVRRSELPATAQASLFPR